MATMHLTDRAIRSLSVDQGVQDFRDETFRGFGVRVTARGTKSFFVMYPMNGRRRRLKLGRYPTLSLADARTQARQILAEVQQGNDPQTDKTRQQQGATFGDLCESFLELYARPRHSPSWLAEEERIIGKDLLPAFGTRHPSQIKKTDIVAMLDEVAKRGPVIANRTKAVLSRILTWAMSRDLIDANPAAGIVRPGKERSRERVLTKDEIRLIWHACQQNNAAAAPMLQLVLLTAQRGGEVRSMRWADIASQWWTIPRAKSGVSHRVYLSSQALEILAGLDSDGEYVFPAQRGKTSHLTRPHKAVGRIAAVAGCAHWTIHDLRRTAATMMSSRLRISPFIIERILGHTDNRVTAIYDRSSYDMDKKEALTSWGRRVQEIVGDATD